MQKWLISNQRYAKVRINVNIFHNRIGKLFFVHFSVQYQEPLLSVHKLEYSAAVGGIDLRLKLGHQITRRNPRQNVPCLTINPYKLETKNYIPVIQTNFTARI